jgi:hypothetical protein
MQVAVVVVEGKMEHLQLAALVVLVVAVAAVQVLHLDPQVLLISEAAEAAEAGLQVLLATAALVS